MKMRLMAVLGVMLLAAPAFGGEQLLKTQKDKESYTTGVEFVRTLRQQGGAIDLDLVIQGIKDGLTGDQLLMSETEIRSVMATRQGGKTGQREAANGFTGILPSSVNAGHENAPTAPKKQETLPSDQSGQNYQLAKSPAQPGQTAPNQQVTSGSAPMAPNGVVLSRRNQAKLGVAAMKAERARAFTNNMATE